MSDHALQRAAERRIPVWAIRAILAADHRQPTKGFACWKYTLPPAERADPRKADLADIAVVVDHYAGCVVTVQRTKRKPGGRANDRRAGDQHLRIYPPHSGPVDPRRAPLDAFEAPGPPVAANGGPGVDADMMAASQEGGGGFPRLAMDGEPSVPLSQDTTPAEFFRELAPIERKFRLIGLGLCGLSALVVLGVFAGVIATLAQLFL
jgi:hypothetical protein